MFLLDVSFDLPKEDYRPKELCHSRTNISAITIILVWTWNTSMVCLLLIFQ